jgi:hypothetical protein
LCEFLHIIYAAADGKLSISRHLLTGSYGYLRYYTYTINDEQPQHLNLVPKYYRFLAGLDPVPAEQHPS